MTLMKLKEDTRNRTYSDRVNFTPEGKQIFLDVANWLGQAKRYDFNKIDGLTKAQQPTYTDRYKDLMNTLGVSETYAKTICNDNDYELALAWRNHKANRKEWHKDIQNAKQNPTKRNKHKALKAQSHLDKTANGPTVCLGGRSLWHKAQTDPKAMQEFKYKRYWLGSIGRGPSVSKKTGYISKNYTNQIIRVDLEGNVSIKLPKGLWVKYGVGVRNSRITIGTINYRHGWKEIQHNITNDKSITYHFRYIKGHWKLLAQLQLPPITKQSISTQRIVGIDVNSGHLDACLLDRYGNQIAKPKTFCFKDKNVKEAIDKVISFATNNGASTIAIEELKGLQRATTRNGGRALNYTINRIPTGQIKDYLAIATENRGLDLIKVNPAGTSKYTVEWKDKLGYKLDTHQLASYLIGRRGLGYSIRRKAYFDSGQDMPKTLSGSLNSGKDGTLQGIQSPLVT